ncbi:helix-turn-helix domain-containing protein [Taibaiella koreensis]|uniref:helix-turn-helix domain-containing protein n=1 Tax=Taibaiella koreensis TaxID=1268548 RepID=UPI0013C2E040|nr:helix-turn-helix domain-containing protein [Taibaiella koreensis]
MEAALIPTHNLSIRKEEEILFQYIALDQRSQYDPSLAHRHSYYEIFLFNKGGGTHQIDLGTYDIPDHSIHFVLPGQVHKVNREHGSYGSILLFSTDFYYLVNSTSTALPDRFLTAYAGGSPVMTLAPEQFAELQQLSYAMGREGAGATDIHMDVVRSYLHIFLLKCGLFAETAAYPTLRAESLLFGRLKQLLEEHYRTQHLPSFYAASLLVTTKKLNELCRQHSGTTLNGLIKERLLIEAKRLLLHTGYIVKEISYHLGFEDPAYFNRFFRKHTGYSAGSFRRQPQG